MCECEVCKHGRIFTKKIEELLPEQRDYFISLYEELIETKFDLEYKTALINGTLSNSVARLSKALERAENNIRIIKGKASCVLNRPIPGREEY